MHLIPICNNFVGGAYRVCCLGNEESLLPDTFRDSGDEGTTDEHGRIYLCGRSDRQIKRRGHRINLDYIEQVSGCGLMLTWVCPYVLIR